MVRPNDQAEHTDTRHGVDHPDRAKHGLTRKGGDHVADLKSGWQASAPHQPKGSFVHSEGAAIQLVSRRFIGTADIEDLGNPGNPRFEAGNSWEPAAFIDQACTDLATQLNTWVEHPLGCGLKSNQD